MSHCLGAGAPNPAERMHLLAASVQGNAFNFPCKIIFKSKGNIKYIIIPGTDFGKKLMSFRSHPIFSCSTYLKEVTFFCHHFSFHLLSFWHVLFFLVLCIVFCHRFLLKAVTILGSLISYCWCFSSSFALHLFPLLRYLFPDFWLTFYTLQN